MNSVMAAIAGLCVLGAEYVINVPEGQVVTNTASISAETAGDVLVKTGKGTWYKSDTIGSPNNFSRMEVREGVFENARNFGGIHKRKLQKIKFRVGFFFFAYVFCAAFKRKQSENKNAEAKAYSSRQNECGGSRH